MLCFIIGNRLWSSHVAHTLIGNDLFFRSGRILEDSCLQQSLHCDQEVSWVPVLKVFWSLRQVSHLASVTKMKGNCYFRQRPLLDR